MRGGREGRGLCDEGRVDALAAFGSPNFAFATDVIANVRLDAQPRGVKCGPPGECRGGAPQAEPYVNALSPVIACPRISVWISLVPS